MNLQTEMFCARVFTTESCGIQTEEHDCIIKDDRHTMQYVYYKCCWFNGDSAIENTGFFWLNRKRFAMLSGGWTWTINCSNSFVRNMNMCLSTKEFKHCNNSLMLTPLMGKFGCTVKKKFYSAPCPKDIYWVID